LLVSVLEKEGRNSGSGLKSSFSTSDIVKAKKHRYGVNPKKIVPLKVLYNDTSKKMKNYEFVKAYK